MSDAAGLNVVRARVDAEMSHLQRLHSEESYAPSPREYSRPRPVQYVRSIQDAMCIHSGWISPRLEGKFLSSVWEKRYGKVLATSDPRRITLLLFETESAKDPTCHLEVDLDTVEFDIGSGMSRKSHRFEIKASLPGEDSSSLHRFEFAVDSRKALRGWAAVFEGRVTGRSYSISSSEEYSSTFDCSSPEFVSIDGLSERSQSANLKKYHSPPSPNRTMNSSDLSSIGSDLTQPTASRPLPGAEQRAPTAVRGQAVARPALRDRIDSGNYQSMPGPASAFNAQNQQAMDCPVPRSQSAGQTQSSNRAAANPRQPRQESIAYTPSAASAAAPMRARPRSNKLISTTNAQPLGRVAEDAAVMPMLEDRSTRQQPTPMNRYPPMSTAREPPPRTNNSTYASQLAQLTELMEQAQRIHVPVMTRAPALSAPPAAASPSEEEQLQLMKALMQSISKTQPGNSACNTSGRSDPEPPSRNSVQCVYHVPGVPCARRVMCLECIQRNMKKTHRCPLCNHDVSDNVRMYS